MGGSAGRAPPSDTGCLCESEPLAPGEGRTRGAAEGGSGRNLGRGLEHPGRGLCPLGRGPLGRRPLPRGLGLLTLRSAPGCRFLSVGSRLWRRRCRDRRSAPPGANLRPRESAESGNGPACHRLGWGLVLLSPDGWRPETLLQSCNAQRTAPQQKNSLWCGLGSPALGP